MATRLAAQTVVPSRLNPETLADLRSVPRSDSAGLPFSNGGLQVLRGQLTSAANEVMRLPFSRNPTIFKGAVEGNIAEAIIPGAYDVGLQHLGAKGETFEVEVLFNNSWLGPDAVPAHLALAWLRMLLKLPGQYRVVWYQGSDTTMLPVRVMGLDYECSLFTPPRLPEYQEDIPVFLGVPLPPDVPQQVIASLKLRRADQSAALINPFSLPLRIVKVGGGKRKKPTSGALDSIASAFDADSLLGGLGREFASRLHQDISDPDSDWNVARRVAKGLDVRTPLDAAEAASRAHANRSELREYDAKTRALMQTYRAQAVLEPAHARVGSLVTGLSRHEARRAIEDRQRDDGVARDAAALEARAAAIYEGMLSSEQVRTRIRADTPTVGLPSVYRNQAIGE